MSITVDMSEIIEQVEKEAAALRDKAAEAVLEALREACPVSEASPTNHDPGGLRDSLEIVDVEDRSPNFTCAIQSELDYCVDETTEILTRRGWMRYDKIRANDETLTLRPDHLAEWQPIDAVHIFDARQRRMLSIESRAHSSLSTEEHRWLVRHRTCWLDRPDTFDLRVRYSAHLSGNDQIPRSAPCVNLPTEPKWSDALVELVAWYYTEGSAYSTGGINIAQSQTVNEENCARISAVLTELFGPPVVKFPVRSIARPAWRTTTREGMTNWYLNTEAASAVRQRVGNSKAPRLEFIHQLTRSQLELFVEVSMLADNNGKERFSQKDPRRCDGFELACILLGYGVRRSPKQYADGVVPDATVAIHRSRYMYVSEARREWVTHDGPVWCPSTANGSWLARRDGTVYFTGNSQYTDEVDTNPHEIVAKNAPMLRFWWDPPQGPSGIHFFFRIWHPGTTGQKWFASKNQERWDDATNDAAP